MFCQCPGLFSKKVKTFLATEAMQPRQMCDPWLSGVVHVQAKLVHCVSVKPENNSVCAKFKTQFVFRAYPKGPKTEFGFVFPLDKQSLENLAETVVTQQGQCS